MRPFMRYRVLLPIALIIGLAPFPFAPEPHLLEKSRMLMDGTLQRPIDIFDLCWHAWPLALLGFRMGQDLARFFLEKRAA